MWWDKTGSAALFDLASDPHERRNLIEDRRYSRDKAELFVELERFLEERGGP
jgi:hypothetical protein